MSDKTSGEAIEETTAKPAPAVTVVGRANRRRLVVFFWLNLALLAVTLVQLAFGTAEAAEIELLVISGLAALLLLSLLRHPWQMTVADGNFSIHRRRQPQGCPIQDVISLEHDADATRLTFRSVAHIESTSVRSRLEKKFAQHGHHLELIGPFSPAQVNQIRSALGMGPLAEVRPGTLAEFQAESRAVTPRVFVTPILVAANVIVYAAMAVCCQSHVQPTAVELVRWGANFGPMTLDGQTWRLFTAMFLHGGLLHLLANMLVLAIIGPLVERMFGNLGFAIVYAISGLWGSVVSVWWHPAVVAVGASGAIFGLYGALGAFLLRQKLPPHVIRRYRGVTIGFVVFNLIFGMSDKRIDIAAHIGGLAAGFVIGLAVGRRTVGSAAGAQLRRALMAALVAVASIALAVHFLNVPIDGVTREFQLFGKTEESVLARTYDADVRHEAGTLSDAEFIAVLEAEGINRWGPALDRLSQLKNVPKSQRDYWLQTIRYAELRLEGWRLLIKGIQGRDEKLISDAREKQEAADAIATEMTAGKKSK